jgi:dipeptidyl aminopeptidase/acylaminoacyl peptidase
VTGHGVFTSNKQVISEETSETVITGEDISSYGRLSPDGGSILFVETPTAPPARLMRIPVSGGTRQLVLETRNSVDFRCARTPANLCVVFETSQDGKQFVITGFEPLKGRGTVLRTIENDPLHPYRTGEVSPDGSLLAISRWGEAEIHLRLLSLSGGSDREITVKEWPNISGLDWVPDGKGFYVGSVSPRDSTLLYVDLKGHARVLWQYKGAGYSLAAPSPDGRYLAIGVEVSYSNVWMVEGF